MNVIDKRLLLCFESIANFFQGWFGVNAFFLAKALLILGLAAAPGVALLSFKSGMISMPGFIFINLAYLYYVKVVFTVVHKGEREVIRNPRCRNPAEPILRSMRFFLVLFGAISAIPLLWHCLGSEVPGFEHLPRESASHLLWMQFFKNVLDISAVYFASCTPKPPQRGKIAALLDSLFRKIFPQESPC